LFSISGSWLNNCRWNGEDHCEDPNHVMNTIERFPEHHDIRLESLKVNHRTSKKKMNNPSFKD
jgi:hypothetical protein